MSNGQQVWWTIVPADGLLTPEKREALVTLRIERNLQPAQDERIPTERGILLQTDAFRPIVWEEQAEAQEFADELASRTRSEWSVIPTHPDEP